jgi:hypothetical protein
VAHALILAGHGPSTYENPLTTGTVAPALPIGMRCRVLNDVEYCSNRWALCLKVRVWGCSHKKGPFCKQRVNLDTWDNALSPTTAPAQLCTVP